MPLDWTPFIEFVQRHQRFLLTTHIRPDGDGLGSMLALAAALQQRGKSIHLAVASVLPPRYDFLDPQRTVRQFQLPGREYDACDAILVLDTGTWNQLGDIGIYIQQRQLPSLVIDHHLTQDDLGGQRLVDSTAEATGRLIYEAISALGETLSPTAAQGLFVALATDTGWFRHSNTTAATLELAARLVEAGANPTTTYEMLFEQNSLARLRLTGLVLDRLELHEDGQVCTSEIRREDYTQTGAVPQDSEDLINYLRSLQGVELAILFFEQPLGGIKVSFRSRSRVDVARLAESFGGGGHRRASGAVLETNLSEARSRILAAVRPLLYQPS